MSNKLKEWFKENIEGRKYQFLSDINSYLKLLLKEKKIRNIIGTNRTDIIIEKHIIPALEIGKRIKEKEGVDVGSGNGLPGIVIAITQPEKKICLMDSKSSRINFLETVKMKVNIKNVVLVQKRAEEAAKEYLYREKYEFATCRAVADLKAASELVLPLLRINGRFYAERGWNVEKDVHYAQDMIMELGGRVEYKEKRLVIIRKEKNTPVKYPRKWKKIKSRK